MLDQKTNISVNHVHFVAGVNKKIQISTQNTMIRVLLGKPW